MVGAILMLLLRAVIAPLYLLLTNVLSYLAALGATIVITEKILGWDHISYRIPLYMFIFLVALGSDYNIFITTRIRSEAMARGLRDGTVKALSATGGVLTSAGIILAGTFLILLSQPVKDLAEISIGVALGVLIDTFLVRTALVPGLTLWIGPKVGWPGPRWTNKGAEARADGRAAAVRGGRRAARGRGLTAGERDPAGSQAPASVSRDPLRVRTRPGRTCAGSPARACEARGKPPRYSSLRGSDVPSAPDGRRLVSHPHRGSQARPGHRGPRRAGCGYRPPSAPWPGRGYKARRRLGRPARPSKTGRPGDPRA